MNGTRTTSNSASLAAAKARTVRGAHIQLQLKRMNVKRPDVRMAIVLLEEWMTNAEAFADRLSTILDIDAATTFDGYLRAIERVVGEVDKRLG